jgi:hypothetical protein
VGDHGAVSNRHTHDPAALNAEDANVASDAIAQGCVPFHAAAIDIDGAIVAFSGLSGSGKSTLAAAAVLAGHRYVADEVTSVSPDDRRVHPYHRPIGLRAGGSDALDVEFPANRRNILGAVNPFPVDDPTLRSPGGELAMILIVQWKPGSTSIAHVEPAEALSQLCQHLVIDDDAVPATFRGVERLVRSVPVRRLTYGRPVDGVDTVVAEVNACRR